MIVSFARTVLFSVGILASCLIFAQGSDSSTSSSAQREVVETSGQEAIISADQAIVQLEEGELLSVARSDLEQQSVMADATRLMAKLAKFQLIISFAGTVLLLITVYLTNSAVIESKKSTKILASSAQAQLRPYICFGKVQGKVTRHGVGNSEIRIKLFVNWINRGQTPAFNVRTTFDSEYLPDHHPTQLPTFRHYENKEQRGALGSNDPLHYSHNVTIEPGVSASIHLEVGVFVLQFKVHYEDYSGREIEQTVTGIFNPTSIVRARSGEVLDVDFSRIGQNSEKVEDRGPNSTANG